MPVPHFGLKTLENFETISVGQAADLKYQNVDTRIWLFRTGIEDGEIFNNKVSIERLVDGQWVEAEIYEAK